MFYIDNIYFLIIYISFIFFKTKEYKMNFFKISLAFAIVMSSILSCSAQIYRSRVDQVCTPQIQYYYPAHYRTHPRTLFQYLYEDALEFNAEVQSFCNRYIAEVGDPSDSQKLKLRKLSFDIEAQKYLDSYNRLRTGEMRIAIEDANTNAQRTR